MIEMKEKSESEKPVISARLYDDNNDKTRANARVVMVIVVGNGHGDMSSNPGRDGLHLT